MVRKSSLMVILFSLFLLAKAGESELFPEVQGWKLKVDEKVYNSGNLWELINGAADIFISYYLQDLHIAEYTKKDQIIRVELYRHKTLQDAYGIYTAERMPDYPRVSVGAQGYKSQGVLNFMAGNYYVKVMSAGVTEADEKSIEWVAVLVETKLAQPKELPAEVSLFPEEGKLYLTDNFVAQNFLGYSFLRNAFSARYEKPVDCQLFILRLETAELQKMLEQYLHMMKEDKVKQKEGFYIVTDLFNGMVFLKQKGEFLVGVTGTGDEEAALAFIQRVIDKIR